MRTLLTSMVAALTLAACYPDPVINERPVAVDSDGDGFDTLVDCDDANPDINPDAEEKCDEIDNDCDALIDELGATDAPIWYVDGDGDGYGDASVTRQACEQPEFYVDNTDDCNDSAATAYPGADELCDDLDNDCDELIDEDALDATLYFWDFDADGYGDPSRPERTCAAASWLVEDNTDCNDATDAIHPGIREICDGIDNDCDELVDDDDLTVDPTTFSTWYPDTDGDGYGFPAEEGVKQSCDGGVGYADNADDCNDEDSSLTTDCTSER